MGCGTGSATTSASASATGDSCVGIPAGAMAGGAADRGGGDDDPRSKIRNAPTAATRTEPTTPTRTGVFERRADAVTAAGTSPLGAVWSSPDASRLASPPASETEPGPPTNAGETDAVPVRPESAAANASQDSNRRAGSFSSARCTAATTLPGTSGRRVDTSSASVVSTFITSAANVGPMNGGLPVSISYRITPRA